MAVGTRILPHRLVLQPEEATHLLRVTTHAVADGDLVGLEVVTVVGELAVVQRKLVTSAELVEDALVGKSLRPLLDVLRPSGIVAVRAVLNVRVIPGSQRVRVAR